MVGGDETIALSTVLKGEARIFTLVAQKEDAIPAKDMDLPPDAKIICYYRDDKFYLVDEDTTFRENDEIVVLTHSKNMSALEERWQPKPSPQQNDT